MVALSMLVVACQPAVTRDGVAEAAQPLQQRPDAVSLPAAPLPLRGDPDFVREALSDEARRWYDALWETLRSSASREWIRKRAAENDLYTYSRHVHAHVLALLGAFRATGDLRLLDEVDAVMEAMRAALADRWREPAPAHAGRDGFLNWVWSGPEDDDHEGRDVHEKDEMGTHGFVATVAWAYARNVDLASPGGVDYQERATFWLEYLRQHFEAKWRERHDAPWPEFPFMGTDHVHETLTFVRYHHYMARLTGEDAYAREAERSTRILFREFRDAPAENGTALVWRRSLVAEGGSEDYLMPTTYTGLVIGDAIDLHLDGARGWTDPSVPTRMATSLREFVMDDGARSFARDIGGGRARAGYPPSPEEPWERQDPYEYAIRALPLAAAFDPTGRIARINEAIHAELAEERPRVAIPAGMLLDAVHGEAAGPPPRQRGAPRPDSRSK